jgi:hypothetical protein
MCNCCAAFTQRRSDKSWDKTQEYEPNQQSTQNYHVGVLETRAVRIYTQLTSAEQKEILCPLEVDVQQEWHEFKDKVVKHGTKIL